MDGMTDPDPSGMDGRLLGVSERGTGGASGEWSGSQARFRGSGQRGTGGSGRGMVRNEPGSEQERVSVIRTGRVWQQG
ncbi:unnamed protein product, partial [Staurois parvus]